ncbi:MAG: VWA domain-containing protein [Acidobacteria bacterium]|nr:VWA domain-containing protein [Acidobacteriota bacterium]
MGDLARPDEQGGCLRRSGTPPSRVPRRRRTGRRACLAGVLLVAVGSAAAKAQPPPDQQQRQQQEQGPAFTAGVELARLDIEVTDGQGRPIRDLRAEEVEIEEGGVRRPVALVQHVRAPLGSYAEAARRTIGGDVSTNRGAPRGRLYVFAFDQSHISPRNEQVARRAVERFLRSRVRAGDRVALYGLPGPGARVGFTSDVSRVVAALPSLSGARERARFTGIGEIREFEAFEIDRGNREVLQQVLLRLSEEAGFGVSAMDVRDASRSVVNRADSQARQFLDTFADLIRALRRIEGRKDVILVSEGFHGDNLGRDLERVAAAAAQSYSAVHALDINRRDADIEERNPLGGQRFTAIESRVAPLGTLAAETDGALFVRAATRLDTVLEAIGGRSGDHYIVGFEPAGGGRDGDDYRRVGVRVTRPGARVRTRTGYAMEAGDPSVRGRRQAIDAALAAPFALQGLRVEYTTYVVRGETPVQPTVVLSLEAELPVAAARAGGAADVVFVVRDARTGQAVASGRDVIPLPSVPAPGRAVGRGAYRVQFEAPPGTYLMRAVVREPGGQIGSADRRFEIPSATAAAVSSSDIILGPATDRFPVRARAYSDDGLSGVVELYGAPADVDAVAVRLSLLPAGEGGAVPRVRTGDLDVVDAGRGGGRRIVPFELPLDGFPAGRYVVEIEVSSDGETVRQVRRELDVVHGSRPGLAAASAGRPARSEILRGQLAGRYLASLGAVAGGGRAAAALARAQQDDWPGASAMISASGPDSGAESAIGELALRGLARFAAGDYAGAAEALDAAFAADADAPRRALTAFFLGWVHAYRDDDRRSASAWRSAVFLDPTLVPAHLALADAYVRLSQPALAAQVLQAGLAALPESPELRDRLSRLTP